MIIKIRRIFLCIVVLISILVYTISTDNSSSNTNLINKVNSVDNQWINYDGIIESDNNMVQSQFIPYSSEEDYKLNNDAYVSYYEGEDFITTELYDADTELETVEDADGVILSFNKENKNGIKLIYKD